MTSPSSPPTASDTSRPGRLSPALLPIFLIVLVDIFGFALVIPLLTIYAESPRFRATPIEATLLVSTFAVCQLVGGPFLGRLSDRIGRKPVLLLSQLGTMAGFLVMAQAQSLFMLYVARAIAGLTAGNLTVAQAYIADNTRPQDRARSFAIIGISFGLGFFVGPATAGKLAEYGLTTPVYAAAGLSLVSTLCTLVLLPFGKPSGIGHEVARAAAGGAGEAKPAGRMGVLAWGAYAHYFRRPELARLFWQFLCFSFAFSTFMSGFALFAERTFTLHGHRFGPHEVGYLLAMNGIFGIVLQGGLMGPLVRRFGEAKLTRAGFLSVLVAQGALGFIHSVGALVFVSLLWSFGTGVLRPALTSLVTRAVGPHEQGVVLGLNQSIYSISMIAAPVVAGALISSGQLSPWAWVGAFAGLVGLVLATVHGRSVEAAVRAPVVRAPVDDGA